MSRANQFFRDILSPFYRIDYAMLARYLTEAESEFISRLRKAEILHSVEAARKTRDRLPKELPEEERNAVIKAVLMHDVGKYHFPMSALTKTMMVLFHKRLSRNPDNLNQYSVLDVYLNHGRYGYDVLKQLDSFPDYPYLYDLVRYHHKPEKFEAKYGAKEQEIFRIYKQADEES